MDATSLEIAGLQTFNLLYLTLLYGAFLGFPSLSFHCPPILALLSNVSIRAVGILITAILILTSLPHPVLCL